MAVVINEFEVVVEPPAPAGGGDAEQGAAAPEAPTPQDIELVNRRQRERAARVHAD